MRWVRLPRIAHSPRVARWRCLSSRWRSLLIGRRVRPTPCAPPSRCMGEWRTRRVKGFDCLEDRMAARVTQGGACVLSVTPARMLRHLFVGSCRELALDAHASRFPGLPNDTTGFEPHERRASENDELVSARCKPSRGSQSPRAEGAGRGKPGLTGLALIKTLEGRQNLMRGRLTPCRPSRASPHTRPGLQSAMSGAGQRASLFARVSGVQPKAMAGARVRASLVSKTPWIASRQ